MVIRRLIIASSSPQPSPYISIPLTLPADPFDTSMMTEDVDVSARVLLDGHTITFCPEAIHSN